ncbi:hypothetical protein GCM10022256_22540 [Frondihabitans peucedani]|uniref:Uncharacterized protein n=1 Tax=Frondihabitans peucedani TaxID=598626 RepID=A0ABP8E3B5_9MICO
MADTDLLSQLKRRIWLHVVRRAAQEFLWDRCTDLAAVLTYHALLSVFPALLAIVGLLGVVGQAKATTTALLNIVQSVAPTTAVALLQQPIEQLIASPSAGFALLVGILAALWSASGYVRAFSRAMNRVYRVEEGRPFWVVAPVMLAVTVALLIVIAIMGVVLVISGPIAETLGELVGLGETAVIVWGILRWPLLVALGIAVLAMLYRVTPNVVPPKARWTSIGAVIALAGMAVASAGFAFYVANFSHYNKKNLRNHRRGHRVGVVDLDPEPRGTLRRRNRHRNLKGKATPRGTALRKKPSASLAR